MPTIPFHHQSLSALAALALFTGLPSHRGHAQIDPAALALARSVAAKLESAQTIRLTAVHHLDPRLGVGSRIEDGPLTITVRRPNRFHVIQPAGAETREIAFDGRWLCLMHPQLKHHAIERLRGDSIEQFADRVDERFGFRPPVAELLSNDFTTQLFREVTSARVLGTERVGRTRCTRLHFRQLGMTGDLWVGVDDRLPRRYLLTFTALKGHPTWDIRLSKWELNVPVDERLFSKRAPAGSQRIRMLTSR
jgi:hypothetical protein